MKELLFAVLLVMAGLLDFYVLPRLAAAGADQPSVAAAPADSSSLSPADTASFYALQTTTLEGQPVSLARWRGQVALVVNVASRCGFTPQYAGLEALYRDLAPRGFVVLGFPSNDFAGQEPGTPEEIRSFCQTNYDVTFPLFAKVPVTGANKCPVYRFLTRQQEEPDWNFTKYLVDREGRVVRRFSPRTAPDDPELKKAIAEVLQEQGE